MSRILHLEDLSNDSLNFYVALADGWAVDNPIEGEKQNVLEYDEYGGGPSYSGPDYTEEPIETNRLAEKYRIAVLPVTNAVQQVGGQYEWIAYPISDTQGELRFFGPNRNVATCRAIVGLVFGKRFEEKRPWT
jgi:hypothetical protein